MEKLRVIEMVVEQQELCQKKISEQLRISIEEVNDLMTELVQGEYLLVNKTGGNAHYTVTEKARDFLFNERDEREQPIINFHHDAKKKVKQAVILARREHTDFDKPVCLIEIDEGVTLLNRMITTLVNNGIEKIIIVSGYPKEAFDSKSFPLNVTVVENSQYKWTGSMASLAAVHEEIDDDFILIEEDLIIEEIAIEKLLNHRKRDCLLITNASGSKDIHQLNRVDGEMVGIAKLSKAVFDEMLESFKENENPSMNYECILLEVSHKIDVGFLKINDLLWAEIDSHVQFDHLSQNIYPLLIRKEQRLKNKKVKALIQQVLEVPSDEIRNIKPFGGMTNLNYSACIGSEEYVVRVPGAGTEAFINRAEEKENLDLGAALGINPEQLYFNTETGLKITKMIPNAETLTPCMTKQEDVMEMVTSILRTLHYAELTMKNTFDLFGLMEKYENIARDANGVFFDRFEQVKSKVYAIREYYETLSVEYAPTHIDAFYENFITSGKEKLYLIDWEYSGMFDPLWDLATHAIESEFTGLEEELFLSRYFQREVTEMEQQRILIHKIFQDYLWTLWTIFKEAKGDNFGTYGKDRFERAKQNIDLYQALYNEVLV